MFEDIDLADRSIYKSPYKPRKWEKIRDSTFPIVLITVEKKLLGAPKMPSVRQQLSHC